MFHAVMTQNEELVNLFSSHGADVEAVMAAATKALGNLDLEGLGEEEEGEEGAEPEVIGEDDLNA